MFNKKKMKDPDHLIEEHPEDLPPQIPINDKRRFDENGARIWNDEPKSSPPVRSAIEIELETKLKAEIERREAAEAKLIGVQAKFDEAKAGLEKETSEMRDRLKKSLEDRANQNKFNFLQTLLPVLDNLKLAVSASEHDASLENLRDGVIGVARSFEHALTSVGVQPVDSIGADFDPELHEAVDMVPVDREQEGKIIAEYQSGYKFGERLLRPARVQVGQAILGSAGK